MGETLITCYADGSCPVPHKEGGWAFAILQTPEENNVYDSGGVTVATNNTMELTAVIRCMQALRSLKLHKEPAQIFTDSMYVVNGMQSWRNTWETNDWQDEIKNKELWKEASEAASNLPRGIRLKWVKGHAGHYYNERCDAMAGNAMRAIRRKL